ncbi:MAG: response regulator transcription factor, partial [Cytophagaceae bacterium]
MAAPAAPRSASAKPATYKIMVVDDDPDIVELLEFNLKKEGYLTASAGDGRRALAVAQDFVPDIILLDVMMPHLDG